MGIAPCRPLRPGIDIALGQIHPAHIARNGINDHNFPVIAEIHLAGQLGETHREKGTDLDALLFHLPEKTVLHVPTPHIIINQPHTHAFAHLGHQSIAHHTPYAIVLDDVELHMNVVLRPCNVAQQVVQHFLSARKDSKFVVGIRECTALPTKQFDKRTVIGRKVGEPALVEPDGRTTGQLAGASLAHEMFPLAVTAKEEINDQPHDWQEKEHHQPSHSLHRLAVFEYHNQHLAQHHNEVESTEHTVDYHVKHGLYSFIYSKLTKKY